MSAKVLLSVMPQVTPVRLDCGAVGYRGGHCVGRGKGTGPHRQSVSG